MNRSALEQLGEAEAGDMRLLLRVDHHVRWLEIAMEHAASAREGDGTESPASPFSKPPSRRHSGHIPLGASLGGRVAHCGPLLVWALIAGRFCRSGQAAGGR